jgi:gamma-glutamylcyclotransferase (GGCT)/AIG2-like uncharacterized protein YtfP/uncharacterized glyoxalase superfamily protein PhnB
VDEIADLSDLPDTRLVTYGTLAPGRVNHHLISDLAGDWRRGTVKGKLFASGWGAALGFPGLILDPLGPLVDVDLFQSADLPAHWARLDEFEGSGYRRVVTTVETAEGERSAWIYVLAEKPPQLEPGSPLTLPAAVPEIPVADAGKAVAYYVNSLGFTVDWGDDRDGIVGISRGDCRLFITDHSLREPYGDVGPILFWLNLHSKAEVDELFAQWKAAQTNIVSEPEDKPWKLREFMAADLDGNLIRVFYDFRLDL